MSSPVGPPACPPVPRFRTPYRGAAGQPAVPLLRLRIRGGDSGSSGRGRRKRHRRRRERARSRTGTRVPGRTCARPVTGGCAGARRTTQSGRGQRDSAGEGSAESVCRALREGLRGRLQWWAEPAATKGSRTPQSLPPAPPPPPATAPEQDLGMRAQEVTQNALESREAAHH